MLPIMGLFLLVAFLGPVAGIAVLVVSTSARAASFSARFGSARTRGIAISFVFAVGLAALLRNNPTTSFAPWFAGLVTTSLCALLALGFVVAFVSASEIRRRFAIRASVAAAGCFALSFSVLTANYVAVLLGLLDSGPRDHARSPEQVHRELAQVQQQTASLVADLDQFRRTYARWPESKDELLEHSRSESIAALENRLWWLAPDVPRDPDGHEAHGLVIESSRDVYCDQWIYSPDVVLPAERFGDWYLRHWDHARPVVIR